MLALSSKTPRMNDKVAIYRKRTQLEISIGILASHVAARRSTSRHFQLANTFAENLKLHGCSPDCTLRAPRHVSIPLSFFPLAFLVGPPIISGDQPLFTSFRQRGERRVFLICSLTAHRRGGRYSVEVQGDPVILLSPPLSLR